MPLVYFGTDLVNSVTLKINFIALKINSDLSLVRFIPSKTLGMAYAIACARKDRPEMWNIPCSAGWLTKKTSTKGNKMNIVKVSLAFAQTSDADLSAFTQNVIDSLTGNAGFPTPAVPLADLTAALAAFNDALVAAAQGGPQETAAKNAARNALVGLLRQEAYYVQSTAIGDLAKLLSSGFNNINTNRTQSQLDAPVIVGIENEMSTQLVVHLQPVPNARAYEAQVKNGTGGFLPAGIFTKARRLVLTGLTPGQTYTVQSRAVGGSTGYSNWSDPVSHMAM